MELITIKDKDKRNFYEKECINSNWSVRELQRQLDTSLFERLLLSDGKVNKEKVLELSREGIVLNKPSDILNYYEYVVNSEEDGKPIGIILCAEKDRVALEFDLGGQ